MSENNELEVRLDWEIIKEYEFLYRDIYNLTLARNKWLNGLEVCTSGARGCGKSDNIMHHLANCFITIPYTINYVVRRTDGQCKKTMRQIIQILALKGCFPGKDFEVNFKDFEIRLKGSYNRFYFLSLNDEKLDVEMGGVLGIDTQYLAKQINVFFEECCHLNKKLVDNLKPTIRGGKDTIKTYFYASNNWVKSNWYTIKCENEMPEDVKKLDNSPFHQFYVNYKEKKIIFRASYKINPFVNEADVADWEKIRNVDWETYKVVALGMAGSAIGAIYSRSLQKMLEPDLDNITIGYKYVGVDWGWGATENSSWSVALALSIDPYTGEVDVFDEWKQHNYGNHMTDDDKMDKIIEFCNKIYEEYGQPVKVYVDNGSSGDFYNIFNSKLASFNLTQKEVSFHPVNNDWKKRHVVIERTRLINGAILAGLIRVDSVNCPMLINELENCYWVNDVKESEGIQFKRSHEYTHCITALEYGIRDFWTQLSITQRSTLYALEKD